MSFFSPFVNKIYFVIFLKQYHKIIKHKKINFKKYLKCMNFKALFKAV